MRPSKSLIVGLIGAVLCAGCVFAYMGFLDDQAQQFRDEAVTRYGGDQLEICVAKRTIAPGETISDSMIETKLWVAALLPDGALSNVNDVVGKQVNAAIYEGEPVIAARLGSLTTTLDIPEGMTAVSVPTRTVQAVGGAIGIGMHVDVYATGATETSLLLSNALVLATSSEGNVSSQDSAQWVVLAVEPRHVQELIAATESLELSFALPQNA